MSLTEEDKQRLKQYKRSRCNICNSPQGPTNPIAKCFECGKKFCFSHIFGGQINDQMAENEEIRDICEKCKERFNYKHV